METADGVGTAVLSNLWPAMEIQNKTKEIIPLVFCHVEGTEDTNLINSEDGNEGSKSNQAEVAEVVSSSASVSPLPIFAVH